MIPESIAHIWLTSLNSPAASLLAYESILSPDELNRANRFRFPHLRSSYVVAHGVLRKLLSVYADRSPEDLRLEYSARGKPFLCDSNLCFNLSHSGEYAAFAFVKGRSVGIDIERIRPTDDLCGLAANCFSREETSSLRRLSGEEQTECFFRLWTLKEAFIKATGEGLSRPLDSFTIRLNPAPSVSILDQTGDDRTWSLHSFAPFEGYFAGLVFDGPPPGLSFQIFTHENVAEGCSDASGCGSRR